DASNRVITELRTYIKGIDFQKLTHASHPERCKCTRGLHQSLPRKTGAIFSAEFRAPQKPRATACAKPSIIHPGFRTNRRDDRRFGAGLITFRSRPSSSRKSDGGRQARFPHLTPSIPGGGRDDGSSVPPIPMSAHLHIRIGLADQAVGL